MKFSYNILSVFIFIYGREVYINVLSIYTRLNTLFTNIIGIYNQNKIFGKPKLFKYHISELFHNQVII